MKTKSPVRFNLENDQLRLTQEQKKFYEDKLEFINEQLNSLSPSRTTQQGASGKLSLRQLQTVDQQQKEQEDIKRAEETKIRLKYYKAEKRERRQRQKESISRHQKYEAAKSEQIIRQQEVESLKKREKYLAQLKSKAQKRLHELYERKKSDETATENSRRAKSVVPLFKKLENEKLKQQTDYEQLIRETTQKRREANRINWSEVKKRSKSFRNASVSNLLQPQKEQKQFVSTFDHEASAHSPKQEIVRKLLKRKQQYSELVREGYVPKVDYGKRAEMLVRIIRSKTQSRLSDLKRVTEDVDWRQPPQGFDPRPFPSNSMVTEPFQRPTPKKLRVPRRYGNSVELQPINWQEKVQELPHITDYDSLMKVTHSLEQLADRTEERMGNKTDLKHLKKADRINDMLISSVTAKLNLLNK